MVRSWLILVLIPALGFAQDFRGALVGRVNDTSGAVIAGASITASSDDSGGPRAATSDEKGEFRISDLQPGSYHLAVRARGMEDAESGIQVEVSSIREIAVRLRPATLRQAVTVEGAASSISTEPLNATSAIQGGVISSKDLQTIPLASRSFANIAFLAPGTAPVEPSDPTKARITAVSFGGSSGLNDVLSVDGGDNSDDYIGGFLQSFSPDGIQEFAVQTAQENAATGRTVGGAVVVTTKRGSNEWHGLGAFYERAAALDARYPIENPAPLPKQPFSRQNYVATLGGAIVKNKLWFFSSYEGVHENASLAYSPASLIEFRALASLADEGLIPGVSSIAVPNNVAIPFRDSLASQRLDWSQSAKSQWFVRGAVDSYTTDNAFVQEATLPSTGTTWHSNYFNVVAGNQYVFSPTWLATFSLNGGFLHTTQERNGTLGFALAFPFSSTAKTISGFETFGDNQFVTPITAFPVLRNQQKYQARYAISHTEGGHSFNWGVEVIHEPVMSGALAGNAENLTVFAMNPRDYLGNAQQFAADLNCSGAGELMVTDGTSCSDTAASNGAFSQNVQRLGVYAQDSWRVTRRLTINYGLRYDTTYGLFQASGQSQSENPALLTTAALKIPLFEHPGAPHDYRLQFAPRLGIVYALGSVRNTVLRGGFGMFYNDLAQNGWVSAFQAVNGGPATCLNAGDEGCLPGAANGGTGALIDPAYKTPYALHITGGAEHAFHSNWKVSADFTHEQGVHAYRRYQYAAGYTLISPLYAADVATQQQSVPNLSVYRTDNRSSYNGLSLHLQGNVSSRFNIVMNYTLASAKTWGCVLGELFDYVNGVCDSRSAFGKGDYGPSGEDIRHRFVLAGNFHLWGGLEITTLSQAESARPFTLTTPVDVNGVGDAINDRAVINGVQTSLDEFRGKPYIQVDLRAARPIKFKERYTLTPFMEFFNLFNRNNPGANYVTNLGALPNQVNDLHNATAICLNASCSQSQPITSLNQLRVPAGALGDFFGPGTTVGIPFAAQVGVRFSF